MKKFNRWTVAWIIWIATFFVLEGAALANKREDDTLSEQGWNAFNIRGLKADRRTWVGRILFLVFGTWLTGHFAFGWWTLSDPCGPFC